MDRSKSVSNAATVRRASSVRTRPTSTSGFNSYNSVDKSPAVAMDEDEFNQGIILPPLIIQLRKILDQYPDDTQILKELIQNAEDAGAKEARFLCDRHSFGQDPRYLHHPDLANFQGPALYAYNDALFSENDWKGIRMLSQSVKQNDPFKVGYFGLGFKSVFHLTDLPCMLSGDKLGLIDPHQQILTASSHGWNISKRPDLLASIPHQLEPFLGIFNCDASCFRNGFYNGTLFRFPLRHKVSALSNVLYTTDKVRSLMQTFEHDAHLQLIFLRNLERIVLYERDKHVAAPRMIFKVEISADCIEEVRSKRASFVEEVRSVTDGQDKMIVSTYPITINTESITDKGAVTKNSYHYLVTNYHCGGDTVSPVFKNLFHDPDLGYLPWVGTAMRIDIKGPICGKDVSGTESTDTYALSDQDGRIFCFLPLPNEQHASSGLAVHIHGFFALEQNRKYIKWPVTNRFPDINMDKGLLWNQCMLREAVPKAYVRMVKEAIRLHAAAGTPQPTAQSIYKALPDVGKMERRWESIVSLIYADLIPSPLIYYTSPVLSEWLEPKAAIFNTLDRADEATSVIMQVMEASTARVVNVPEHVLAALKKYCRFSLGQITATVVSAACRDVQFTLTLQWECKMKLLRYFLKQSKFELLDGLELLPLANGGFEMIHFNPKKADRVIYVAPSEEMQSLLPGLRDDFLESDIDADVKQMLVKASQRGYTQLKVLDAPLVGQLLPRCLPPGWVGENKGPVEWCPQEPGHPPEKWLESLWLFMARCSPRDLSTVDGLPILPGRTFQRVIPNHKEPVTIMELLPLSSSSVSIARTMDGLSLSADVEEIIHALGIAVVDDLPDYVKAHPLVSKLYIFSPTYLGVLKAIDRKCSSDGREVVIRRLMTDTSAQHKRSLRCLLAKISLYEIQRDSQDLLSQLPLFETMISSGGTTESRFVSAAAVGLGAPPEKLSFPVSRLLLDISSPDSQALAKLLSIKQLNMAQLLTQIVFPDVESAFYDNSDVQKIMLYVLKHYQHFTEIDKTFRKTLKSLAFLPKGDMLLTPDRFYDPDHELLQKLFLFEENFPGSAYSDPAMVMVLRDIGLRGVEDVEPEDLQESALTIQKMANESKVTPAEKLIEKADALLEYLHRHKSRLKAKCSGSTLAEALRSISWVRCLATRPTFYPGSVPWFQGGIFHRPSELTLRANVNVCGSTMPVVAAVDVYVEVAQVFNWHKPVPLDIVVTHLANVVTSYDTKDKVLFVEIARNIYAELMKYEFREVAALLSSKVPTNWVWHGDGFTCPSSLVLIQPFMDLRPFVYSLPQEMAQFESLFKNCGVLASCSLPEVLHLIKQKYDDHNEAKSRHSGTPSSPRSPLPSISESEVKRDLHISVCVLNELKSHLNETSLSEIRDQLYLPVHSSTGSVTSLRLAPIAECTYCDDEWLRQDVCQQRSTNNRPSDARQSW